MTDEPTPQPASAPSAPSSSAPPSPSTAAASPPASGSPQPTTSTPASSAPPAPATAKVDRPTFIPESYWDPDKAAIKNEFGDHYKELATFKATEDSRRLTLPKTPAEYQPVLPKDFQAPQGIEYAVDTKDPLLAEVQQVMHDIDNGKLSGQDAFSKILGVYAAKEIGTVTSLKAARDAEVAKLGPTGGARVTAVQGFLNAQLGEQMGKLMGTMMVTAGHVQGFEKLMATFRSQGAGTYSPGRDPAQPAKVSDAEYDKMSYSEKKAYSARMNGHSAA